MSKKYEFDLANIDPYSENPTVDETVVPLKIGMIKSIMRQCLEKVTDEPEETDHSERRNPFET